MSKIDLSTIPKQPGVYIMKSSDETVLYIGKAKNLRVRVKQYFVPGQDSREMIPHLVKQVSHIETIIVSSEKEALLLENTLIKRHKPKYNVFFKDDKSYICLAVTYKDRWPTVKLQRYKGKPKNGAMHFGPYTSAYAARQTLDLINRIFPLRQCSNQEFARRTRPCILYGMKRCIAPCVDLCTHDEYMAYTQKLVQFLKGKDKQVIVQLKNEMAQASESLEFERAGALLESIKHLEKTIEQQHVDILDGSDRDVFGLYREASEITITQMTYRSGTLIGSRNYDLTKVMEEDREFLPAWLIQRYEDESDLPKEILLPSEIEDHQIVEEILGVSLLIPKRGKNVKLIEMAHTNAKVAFQREKTKRAGRESLLSDLQEALKLRRFPRRIECFDNSNLSGTHPVASLVTFLDGEKDSKHYRLYNLKTDVASDDYAAMREVLTRRYQRARDEDDLPDLIIVDGGKGHLHIALNVLADLDITNVDVIGLAKEQGRHDKGMTDEQIILPDSDEPLHFSKHSQVLFLLQRIRDEAHRRAIGHQRKRHRKGMLKSDLDNIPGIGPIKKKRLLKHFGSLRKLKEASEEAILAVQGITKKDALTLKNHLGKNGTKA